FGWVQDHVSILNRNAGEAKFGKVLSAHGIAIAFILSIQIKRYRVPVAYSVLQFLANFPEVIIFLANVLVALGTERDPLLECGAAFRQRLGLVRIGQAPLIGRGD